MAPANSASNPRAASGSSDRASSKASPSSSPGRGESWEKRAFRASSRRDVVRRRSSLTLSRASAPS
ncbi:MAG: hypothetical protein ACYCS2_08455 [Acidimicrobiales bacterium]